MTYNKILPIAAASLLLLAPACNKENDFKSERTLVYTALNLLTPSSESEPSFITSSTYNFHLVAPDDVITTECENFVIGNSTQTLAIPSTSFKVRQFADGELIEYFAPSGSLNGQNGLISNFNCKLSSLFYRSEGNVPGVDNSKKYDPVVIAQFNIGSRYAVATFQSDVTYRGITTTTFSYQGQDMVYKTKAGSYRVVINPSTMKADVVLYRVKFAEQAPALILVLKDLDVKLGRNGYTISGTDVVPGQQDGNMLTPNTSFPFETFTLTTVSDDLTKIQIDYTVRNKAMEDKVGNGARVVYVGSFSGCYVSNPDEPFNPDTPIED